MQHESLELLQETAVKASGNRIVKPEAEPDHVYGLIGNDGEIELFNAKRQPHNHRVNDFESLAVRVAVANEAENKVSVWFSADRGAVAILSDDYRDKASLILTHSRQFKQLCEWRKEDGTSCAGIALTHKQIFTYLRRLFRGCVREGDTLLRLLGKVNWKAGKDTTTTQARAKTSMDRDMYAEAAGLDDLPEVITFDVPFFAEPVAPVRVQVSCVFDPDAEDEVFRLFVVPGEIEKATFAAESFLAESIDKALSAIMLPAGPASEDGKAAEPRPLSTVCPIYNGQP